MTRKEMEYENIAKLKKYFAEQRKEYGVPKVSFKIDEGIDEGIDEEMVRCKSLLFFPAEIKAVEKFGYEALCIQACSDGDVELALMLAGD